MSTILDALKRVEEQLRAGAKDKTAEGLTPAFDLSAARYDSPIQPKNAIPGESDEVTKVYLSLVNMIAGIQDRVQTVAQEERAAIGESVAELAKAMAAIRNDLLHQQEAFQRAAQQHEADREAGDAALTAAQSQIDPLRRAQAETQKAVAELAQAMLAVRNDSANHGQMLQETIQKRDADRQAGDAALTALRSQIDPLKRAQAETPKAIAELAQVMLAVRNDSANHRQMLQEAIQKRDADREAGDAALTALQSQIDPLKNAHADTQKVLAEWVQAVDILRSDLARHQEASREGTRQREMKRGAGDAASMAVQSQIDPLKHAHADTQKALAELVRAVDAVRNDLTRHQEASREATRERDMKCGAGDAALTAVQSQIDPLKHAQAETQEVLAELVRAVDEIRNDLTHHQEASHETIPQREAAHGASDPASTLIQSQIDPLKHAHAGTQKVLEELVRVVDAVKADLARHQEASQDAVQQREAIREAVDDALTQVQSRIDPLKHAQTETQKAIAELVQAMAAVRNDLVRHRQALEEVVRQRDAEREAGKATLASAQSQIDPLGRAQAETQKVVAELSQTVDSVRNDLTRHREAFQKMTQQRDAERKAGEAAFAVAQSQIDPIRHAQSETQKVLAELAQAMDSARNDFTRERDAKRDTGDTAMATVRSQIAALSQSQAEAHKALAEMAYAMGAIRNDLARQRDAFQEGARLRDAEREAGNAALAVLQSQIDSLKQLLASPDFGPQDKGFAAEGPEASAPAQHGRQQTIGGPIEEKPGLRPPVDKYEAQKLRSAAGEAFTRGDFLETLRLLDAIDAAFPDNKSILYNRAECLVKLGRNAEARTLCDYLIVRLGHLPAEALKNRIVD